MRWFIDGLYLIYIKLLKRERHFSSVVKRENEGHIKKVTGSLPSRAELKKMFCFQLTRKPDYFCN